MQRRIIVWSSVLAAILMLFTVARFFRGPRITVSDVSWSVDGATCHVQFIATNLTAKRLSRELLIRVWEKYKIPIDPSVTQLGHAVVRVDLEPQGVRQVSAKVEIPYMGKATDVLVSDYEDYWWR